MNGETRWKKSPITDHAFKPCYYSELAGRGIGCCMNPTGWDGCHVNGCGLSRERHEAVEPRKPTSEG